MSPFYGVLRRFTAFNGVSNVFCVDLRTSYSIVLTLSLLQHKVFPFHLVLVVVHHHHFHVVETMFLVSCVAAL